MTETSVLPCALSSQRQTAAPRSPFVLGGVALCALVLVVASSSPAYAYTPRAFGGCLPITWAVQPKVVVHISEFAGPDLFENIANLLRLTQAMLDVHEQFNLAGATAAQVTAFESSTEPFVFQAWFGDATPTIHVGFTSDPTAAVGSTYWDVDPLCNIVEAHIQFRDPYVYGWTFSDPSTHGEDYYDATLFNNNGDVYFRISYMHELLHAFGLAHSNDSYSMLNYADRPYANRPVGDRIRPLPDDVQGLRALYPLLGVRREVAVLNTWYEPIVSSAPYPAANQFRLCKPSLGTAWNADFFANVCGLTNNLAGSTTVAAGDTLRTRFAFANYSTESVDVVASLYFSSDDVWDAADVASVTTRSFTVNPSVSSLQGRVWTVPSLNPGTYYVIVRVEATTTAGVLRTDWIPLRGTVTVN